MNTVNWSELSSETLPASLVLAGLSALLATLAYLGKSIAEYTGRLMEERRLYRTAVIRFYNDVLLWQRDFRMNYTDTVFDQLASMVIDGPEGFKFSIAPADASDAEEIMKFIHRMDIEQARIIRTFIVYSEMLTSIGGTLSGTLGDFDKPRKLRALALFKETAEFVQMLSDEVLETMQGNRFLRTKSKRFDEVLSRQALYSARGREFAARHSQRLTPPPMGAASGAANQSNGGKGPDMIDLQDLMKLAHKIATAYRKFNSSS